MSDCKPTVASDNWYCHNICNYTKLDQWNNHIFSRYFPDNVLTQILDPRPDFRVCGNFYRDQPSGPVNNSKKPIDLNLNLDPFREDRDCYFCRILNSLSPDRGDALNYLRKIDIDSHVRGLTQRLTLCPQMKTDGCCIQRSLCRDCDNTFRSDPLLVKIIQRWGCNYQPCMGDTFQRVPPMKPVYYNGCPGTPIEHPWNNFTKTLDQWNKTKYCASIYSK